MRLIDADKFKRDILKKWQNVKFSLDKEQRFRMNAIVSGVLKDIDEQPTAYYLDSVLYHLQKELKETEEEKERTAKENPSQFDVARGYEIAISNAIEYVKGGVQ